MEALEYAFGAADLCAAGIGAPHPRQRLYFVGLADTDLPGPQGRIRVPECSDQRTAGESRLESRMADANSRGFRTQPGDNPATGHRDSTPTTCFNGDAHADHSFWGASDWLFCRDGLWRPVEPGSFPLADGLPGRVAHLRGYGNAIVPQVAATFIKAALNL
jgi:DNA (cytosine-5)-methyltransferase 1